MALIWHGNKVSSKIQNEARRRVREAALVVEKNAKGLMVRGGRTASGFLESIEGRRREPGTGKRPGKIGSFASKPGEPPRVQTGTLRRSITHEMHPTLPIARVGTNVFYGKHLELGTPRMAKAAGVTKRESARPFMRPALHRSKKAIMAIFSRRMKD